MSDEEKTPAFKTQGGYAFPAHPDLWLADDVDFCGMTLRDYFAAQAMQALIPIWYERLDFDLCLRAYRTADNMLAARSE